MVNVTGYCLKRRTLQTKEKYDKETMRIQNYTTRKRGKTRLNEINHVQLLEEKKKNKYLNCFLSHLSRFKFYKGKSFDVSSVFESWDAKRSLTKKINTLPSISD